MICAHKGNDFWCFAVFWKRLLVIRVECTQQGVHFLSAFEGSNEVAFLVIQCQVGQVANLVERRQDEFFVTSNQDIGMVIDFVMFIEVPHFGEGLIGSHHDLDVLKIFKVSQDCLGLVLAVFAVGAEKHHDGATVLPKVILGQIGGAIKFQQVESGDSRESHKGGRSIGRIGSWLVGQSGGCCRLRLRGLLQLLSGYGIKKGKG